MPHVVQELLSHPEYLPSSSVFNGIRVTPSLVFCRTSFYALSFDFAWSLCFLSLFDLRLLNASFSIVKHIVSSVLCSISVEGECGAGIICIVMQTGIFVKAGGWGVTIWTWLPYFGEK